MTPNQKAVLGTLGGFVVGLVAYAVLQPPKDAWAAPVNRSVTIVASSAFIHTVCFRRQATGGPILGEAFGEALTLDGGIGEKGRAEWMLPAGQRTTVHGFMDAQAVTQWRTDFGLEQ